MLMLLVACFFGGPEDKPTHPVSPIAVPEVPDDPSDPVDTGSWTPPTTTTPDHPSAPTILSMATNRMEMTEGDLLTITAIVTDPDGIEDLIGGELRTPGGATYGVFSTAAQEGAYEIVLTWNELDAVEGIEFEGTAERLFVARFYDVAGHTTEATGSLQLYCDGGGACGGSCEDLSADPLHCGACGHTCDDRFTDACRSGSCIVEGSCTQARFSTCDDLCADEGLGSCVEAELDLGWTWMFGGGTASLGAGCMDELVELSDCATSAATEGTGGRNWITCFCLEP